MHLSLSAKLGKLSISLLPGILDQVPGAAAAYSLRALRKNMGNVVNVRRSSDDAEQAFTAQEVSDGTLVAFVGAGNDGFVETWYDQSGNGRNATQDTDANQPQIVANGALVTGGIDFDGVDDQIFLDSNILLSTNDFFVTSVIKILDGARDNLTLVNHPNGNRFLVKLDYDSNTARMRSDDGAFIVVPFPASAPTDKKIITIQREGNTATLFQGGNSEATFGVTNKNFTLGQIGQYFPNDYSKQSMSELIIYPSNQSANRAAIEANIADQYGITLA